MADYDVGLIDDDLHMAKMIKTAVEERSDYDIDVDVYLPGEEPEDIEEEIGFQQGVESSDYDVVVTDHSLPWGFSGMDVFLEGARDDASTGVVLATNAIDGYEGFDVDKARRVDARNQNVAYTTKRNATSRIPEKLDEVIESTHE
jgi:hypothetical protein